VNRFLPSAPTVKNASTPVKIRPRKRTETSALRPRTLPVRADALKSPCGRSWSKPPLPPLFPPASRPHGCSKKIKIIFFIFLFYFGSCCRLEKRKKNFGFQFPRSPRSLNSPSSPSSECWAGVAARRRFFRPSSPSHPSKLYSSLGWLNSKVPKPFFPFTLRLIDVHGF
jgi:hypothetical protein